MTTHPSACLWGNIAQIFFYAALDSSFMFSDRLHFVDALAGVISMTKTIAKELAAAKIRCNVVLPGFTATPMTATVPEKMRISANAMTREGRLQFHSIHGHDASLESVHRC